MQLENGIRLNVLIASELGGGLGHAVQIQQIVRSLATLGLRPTVAVRSLESTRRVLGYQAPCEILQAPIALARTEFHRVNSFADILIEAGFASETGLTARLKAWVDLMRMTDTKFMIVDHAPTALFAAQAIGVRAAAVTSAFHVPPAQIPFPVLSPGIASSGADRLGREQRLHQNLHRALDKLGLSAPPSLQQPFATIPKGLSTFPELDHYRAREDVQYLGCPIPTFGEPHRWPMTGTSRPRVLVYAPWSASIRSAIASLLEHRMQVCAVVRGAPDDAFAEDSNFLKMPGPVDIDAALAECDAFVNHGSVKSVVRAIGSGKPSVMIPQWQEQEMFSRRAMNLGAGVISRSSKVAESVHFCLHQLQPKPGLHALRKKIKRTDADKRHADFLSAVLRDQPLMTAGPPEN